MLYLAYVVKILCDLLNLAIVIRILLSWVQLRTHHPIITFIHDVTEPILSVGRRVIPRIGIFDLSPIIILFALDIVKNLLLNLLGFPYL